MEYPLKVSKVDEVVKRLAEKGEHAIRDRFMLRLVEEVDQDAELGDYEDCYGLTAWSSLDRDTGKSSRPEGFDDDAQVIIFDHPDYLWWQPPEGLTKAQQEDEFYSVQRLAVFGFTEFGVILEEVIPDSFGNKHRVKINQSWLGGTSYDTDEQRADCIYGVLECCDFLEFVS